MSLTVVWDYHDDRFIPTKKIQLENCKRRVSLRPETVNREFYLHGMDYLIRNFKGRLSGKRGTGQEGS